MEYVCICMYVFMYVCMYVCMYVYTDPCYRGSQKGLLILGNFHMVIGAPEVRDCWHAVRLGTRYLARGSSKPIQDGLLGL